jgi:hypothetical protein
MHLETSPSPVLTQTPPLQPTLSILSSQLAHLSSLLSPIRLSTYDWLTDPYNPLMFYNKYY